MPLKAPAIVFAYFFAAYLGGLFLKNNSAFLQVLARLPAFLLLFGNTLFVLGGIPLSALGDLLLLRKLGAGYLLFWPLFVGLASCLQVILFRSRPSLLWSKIQHRSRHSARLEGWLRGTSATLIVLVIRSIPIMPFLAGSYVIANLSRINIRRVLILSIAGSYLYYLYFGGGYFLGFSSELPSPSISPDVFMPSDSVPST